MFFSEKILRGITDEFIGDSINSNFKYKSGSILVTFVNSFFSQNDRYDQGFPSRWLYLYDYLKEIDEKKMESFFQFILSEQYLRREEDIPKENIFHFINESIEKFNNIIDLDGYKLNRVNGILRLVNIGTDLVFINSGGFAEVYYSKSSGYAIKKLKDDIRFDTGISHRFKREYEITKGLSDIHGVIPVYNFREQELSYEMLYCTKTLENIINDDGLTEPDKDAVIDFIVEVMEQVHHRNVIHRDLSLNNVLFNNGEYYISDFGLGKSLGKEYTHQTINTMGVGQLLYVAPEQINSLAESNKYSDVFSLGKMINSILTGDPRNDNHKYQSLCIKATATSVLARYQDASELKRALKKFRERKRDKEFEEHILNQLQDKKYTEDIELYIQGLSYFELATNVVQKNGFKDMLIIYIHKNPSTTTSLLEFLLANCADITSTFEDADLFGEIGYSLLKNNTVNYSYDLKVAAAKLVRWAAWEVNRYNMQDKIHELVRLGIDPTLEEILEN